MRNKLTLRLIKLHEYLDSSGRGVVVLGLPLIIYHQSVDAPELPALLLDLVL